MKRRIIAPLVALALLFGYSWQAYGGINHGPFVATTNGGTGQNWGAVAANSMVYFSGAGVMGTFASANNGVVITSADGVPSVSSTLPNAVQDLITRLGAVTTVANFTNTGTHTFAGHTDIVGQSATAAITAGWDDYIPAEALAIRNSSAQAANNSTILSFRGATVAIANNILGVIAAGSAGGENTFMSFLLTSDNADKQREVMRLHSGGLVSVNYSFAIASSSSPASNAACTTGQVSWDASYVYICTASTVWKRAALTGGY